MCGYTGKHFGASYDDAECIDGYLWDLDSYDGGMLGSGGDIPCPECNTAEYLDNAKDDAETTEYGSYQGTLYSGAMLIEGAISTARSVAPNETAKWISDHQAINSFDWPDRKGVLEGSVSPETISEIKMVIS